MLASGGHMTGHINWLKLELLWFSKQTHLFMSHKRNEDFFLGGTGGPLYVPASFVSSRQVKLHRYSSLRLGGYTYRLPRKTNNPRPLPAPLGLKSTNGCSSQLGCTCLFRGASAAQCCNLWPFSVHCSNRRALKSINQQEIKFCPVVLAKHLRGRKRLGMAGGG